MNCTTQALKRGDIERLAKCLPLIKSPELMVLVAHIVCTGFTPSSGPELLEGEEACSRWLTSNKVPLRFCRPGHAWDVERSVSEFIRRVLSYARRGWDVKEVSSLEIYWSYRRYEERQHRITNNISHI